MTREDWEKLAVLLDKQADFEPHAASTADILRALAIVASDMADAMAKE